MSTSECEVKCAREKYWGECSQEEKIERLAKGLYDALCDQVPIGRRVDKLFRHKHMPDGTIVCNIDKGCGEGVLRGGNYQFDRLQRKAESAAQRPIDIERDAGQKAALLVAEHLMRMNAEEAEIPIKITGTTYRVGIKLIKQS